MIGLYASGLQRMAVGAVFCCAAIALVWWVEREPTPSPVAALAAPSPTRRLQLAVESTYPVASWTVQVLGVDQPGAATGAYGWSGTVNAPTGEEVVVTAVAAPTAEAPNRGLRLRLGDAPERLVWGAGDVVATGTLP